MIQQLLEDFKSKECRSYRTIPFWSWNDKLETEELKNQIHWMNDNGIGGYFMHARSGLQTEYLSEEWMQCIDACIGEGQKLDMKNWIYDENGWPSGFAGGKLLENEKDRDRYILYTIGTYDPEATVSYFMEEEKLLRVTSGERTGEYLNLYIHTATSTADILNPEVVDKFIALTHEQYKERYGESFAEKVEGFFTDEPQYQRWNTPYTDMMEQYFREKFDEDILDSLGLLFVEKEGYRKFRYRYWKGMQELMLKNFAEKIYRWCDENGVKLTGHYVEESTMGLQMMCCGGVMPFYEYEHIPGIDWLGRGSEGELAPKQVASVAAQLGRKQVLTETFGCCGWDVSLSDLKRIAGFQYVNGVNMMCHHLVPYSERGNRKYDYPAHYSAVNPWVGKEFKTFNDYFTRLGYLLGEGKKYVNTAVLHPIRSAYFNYKREKEAEWFNIENLDRNLKGVCRMLSARGLDYHFLDETLLEKYGFAEDGHIGCGQCTYDYLILPMMDTMDVSTERFLRQYVKQGGKVLLLDKKPEYLEADTYDYSYLESNCTLDEILADQPYRVSNEETDIRATYRTYEGMKYLYVMNASATEAFTQTYDFGEEVKSFVKVDLTDMSTESVPLTIALQPGEDALLFLSGKEADEKKQLTPYRLKFENARVDCKENYLVVDHIRYSKDGQAFSKPLPCAALFQKLIREQYEGSLFLRYEFEVQDVPETIYLNAEDSNEVRAWLNGVALTDKLPVSESYINRYDISSLVKQGYNEYTAEVNWHEDPFVYYALYGENVTESLKNSVVYDSELQPIQITGQFGVYPKEGYQADKYDERFVRGTNFYVGRMPETVADITTEGFPFFAGSMTLRQKVTFDSCDILLQIEGTYQMAEVTVNGEVAGNVFFKRELDISKYATIGENLIEIKFYISNRNLMGPHHLEADPNTGISPWSFELCGSWEEDRSEYYHDDYSLCRFYTK